jgi:beta-lactam-binding protein with PASTA domain
MTAALAQVPVTPFPAVAGTTGGTDALRPVPSVVGMPADQADDRLGAEGFHGVRVTVANGDYPPGFVVGQSPCAGCLAPGGSAITLQVGNGKATARVPSVLGNTEDEARQALDGAGFAAKVVTQADPSALAGTQQPGQVWKQTPAAGASTQVGSTVTVWVAPDEQGTTTTG